jgi:uncharacterized membrane protein YfcA
MEHDFLFWAVAGLAVILTGLSKGGFGGMALLAVPLMALVMSPTQAAAIMLPILITMDMFSLYAYRKFFKKEILYLMLPAAILGIGLGWFLAHSVSENNVRISVGLIAVIFSLYSGWRLFRGTESITPNWAKNKWIGRIAGMAAGFTSFFAHAGGPPFQAYVVPQKLDSRVFAGTGVIFFSVVNAVKLVPYAMLGQLSPANMSVTLYLIPLAPLGVWMGVWGVKRLPVDIFYKIIYSLIFGVGLKLLYDGIL